MKLRIVEETRHSGVVMYLVQEKILFWWVTIDTYVGLDHARDHVARKGKPKRKVIE